MLSEPFLVVAKLARVFDAMEIRYVVGGSVASSIYGIPRATQDVDLVAARLGSGEPVVRLWVVGPRVVSAVTKDDFVTKWAPRSREQSA